MKLRIWNKSSKTLCFIEWGIKASSMVSKSDDLIPMLYTGLKDKNGVEIYQGDIIKGLVSTGYGFTEEVEGEVEFLNGILGIKKEKFTYDGVPQHDIVALNEFKWAFGNFKSLEADLPIQCEVIGNNYEV